MDAYVREGQEIDANVLHEWLEQKRTKLNEKQHEFLTLAVKRVMVEFHLVHPKEDDVAKDPL
eukprot:5642179-Amphidinium_carterae.1